jgi:hypothetical protein
MEMGMLHLAAGSGRIKGAVKTDLICRRGNLGESVPPLMADQREEIGGDAGPFRIGTRKPDREAEPGPELPGPSIGNVQADPKVAVHDLSGLRGSEQHHPIVAFPLCHLGHGDLTLLGVGTPVCMRDEGGSGHRYRIAPPGLPGASFRATDSLPIADRFPSSEWWAVQDSHL